MKYEKPDGVIECGLSGCCCPPGQRGPGMHTCCTTQWWRVNQSPWFQPSQEFSSSDLRVLAGASETCWEFLDVVMDVGPTEYERIFRLNHQ